MKILLINCGSRALKELVATIKKLGAEPTLVPIDELPVKSVKGYNGIVISGSPLMWSECQNQCLKKFEFLKKVKLPVLGICFGHQAIGLLYGSTIRHEKLLKDKIRINFTAPDDITKGFNKSAIFAEYHSEYISLPKKFILLATSGAGNIELMRHPSKPIYASQFHPELSGKNGETFLKNFFNMCEK